MSSDEASSGVTYTSISSDYEEPSDAGSPRVVIYRYDRLPMHLPYAADVSPTALSPGYIVVCDLEDESEYGPTDYPTNEGDDDDDDDTSGDDADDEDEEEAFEEDKEHLAPADSTVVSPAVDPVPSAEEIEPFETDDSTATPPPPPAYCTTSRMSVRSQAPIPFPSKKEVARLFVIPTPPPSPLTPLSSPRYRAARIRLRAASPLPLPSPPPSSPLLLPFTNHRADISEVVLPPRKRLCLALGPRFEVGESSSDAAARPTGGYRVDYGLIGTMDVELRRDRVREIGYGITDVWEDPTEATKEVPSTTVAELSQRVTDLVTTVRQDTDEIYVRFEDAHNDRALLRGQVNMLRRDRHYHINTAMLVESEARVAQEDTRISSLEALVTTLISQTTSLQTQLIAALGRIDTLEAREPAHIDNPEDVDSCS
ncbi:hypothetical protein Tco_0910634 [Tanacetum coccineum]|uniref:Uncharacterized protein n=1 Tax=Tanacetum coccineum TaxID=301880 RepID=A0ABQ5CZR4_9ASTR